MPDDKWPDIEEGLQKHFEKEWKNWDEYKAKLDTMSEIEVLREIAYNSYVLMRKG